MHSQIFTLTITALRNHFSPECSSNLSRIKQAKLVQWYIVYSHVLVFYKHLNISILYKI